MHLHGKRRGFSREVPNWMLDESYCAGMALGPSQVSIDGLNELAVVLKRLVTNQASGARSPVDEEGGGTCGEKAKAV